EIFEFIKGQPASSGDAVEIVNGASADGDFGAGDEALPALAGFGEGAEPPIFASLPQSVAHTTIGDRKESDLAFGNQPLKQFVRRASQVHPFGVRPDKNMVRLENQVYG